MELSTDVNGSKYNLSKILENAKFIILDPDIPIGRDDIPDYDQDKLFGLIDDSYANGERTQIYSGLEYLKILCNDQDEHDTPEFVDVDKLSSECEQDFASTNDSPRMPEVDSNREEDDTDDVIFVSEYRYKEEEVCRKELRTRPDQDQSNVRRNPMRNARSKSRNFRKDLIFEDEFGFLDSSSDEESNGSIKIENDINKVLRIPPKPSKRVHFDANERAVCKSTIVRQDSPDLTTVEQEDTLPKIKTKVIIKKKSKKNYTRSTKRRPVVQKKWLVQDLLQTVSETTKMMTEFVHRARTFWNTYDADANSISVKKCTEALKNQAILYSVVSGGEKFDFKSVRCEILNDEYMEKLQD